MKEGWTYKKLGEVCKVIMGQSPDGESVNDTNGIEFHQGKVFFGEKYLKVSNSFTEQPSKIAEPNSVLLCVRAPVGVVNLTLRRICIGRGLCAIQPNDNIIMPFIYYALTTKRAYFDKNSTGSTFKAISSKIVTNTVIPVPPIAEQERIVAELDLLSGIMEKKKEQLKAYDQLAQSIFYTMFGDPIDNPKGWETKKLGEVTTKIGSGATPKGGNQSYKKEGISLIRSLNVHNGSFKYDDLAHIDEQQAHQLNNVIIEENDVLFNITGASVARCCIVPSDVLPARVNQHVSILRPKKEIVNHVYLCYYLISPNSQNALLVMSKSNAATREALPKSMMEKYSICIPPLSLQQEFAEKVEAIERQKALVQQSIEETQTMFDYTMDKYFG